MRKLIVVAVLFVAVAGLIAVLPSAGAQGECTALVQEAMAALSQNCSALDRNQACYAFGTVNATLTDDAASSLSEPAAEAALAELQFIQTMPLDPASEQWGIAVLNVQANVPSADGQGVAFLLLGDVQLENAVAPEDAFIPVEPVAVTALVGANLRTAPSTQANVANSVPGGAELQADGLSSDGAWLRVLHEDTMAWVNRDLVGTNGSLDVLPVITGNSRTPMQEFTLRTGGDAACSDAPPSMLVIQGPEGVTVELVANGATIRLSSTAVLRTVGNELQLMVLDGLAQLGNLNVPAGFSVTILLNPEGQVDGIWSHFSPISEEDLALLATLEEISNGEGGVLNYAIHVPTAEDIEAALALFAAPAGGRTGPAAGQVDCSRFRATSPLGGMPNSQAAPFYWDAALGADNYVVIIRDPAGSQRVAVPTNSANTTLTLNTLPGAIGDGSDFSWEVEAYVGGQLACSTSPANVVRDAVPQFVGEGGGGGQSEPPPCQWSTC